jgi:hypothetical protein
MRAALLSLVLGATALAFTPTALARWNAEGAHTPQTVLSDPSFPQPGSGGIGIGGGVESGAGGTVKVMSLADALTLERKAGVWYDYARDVANIVRPLFFYSNLRRI